MANRERLLPRGRREVGEALVGPPDRVEGKHVVEDALPGGPGDDVADAGSVDSPRPHRRRDAPRGSAGRATLVAARSRGRRDRPCREHEAACEGHPTGAPRPTIPSPDEQPRAEPAAPDDLRRPSRSGRREGLRIQRHLTQPRPPPVDSELAGPSRCHAPSPSRRAASHAGSTRSRTVRESRPSRRAVSL
jgi:hypothetical protein